MSIRDHFRTIRPGLLALATLPFMACMVETSEPQTGTAEQLAISNQPPPGNLHLVLNAKTSLEIGSAAGINGDVASTGVTGSVFFDISAKQNFYGNLLADSVDLEAGSSVGHVFANDIIKLGTDASESLGFDPNMLPPVPDATPADPAKTSVSVPGGHLKQLCAGHYGAISVGTSSTLNLNGGVYHMSKLTLADGAKLEPSEPVVLLVAGSVSVGKGAFIGPYPVLVNPMSAGDVRIEVGSSATLGDTSEVHAHLLVPKGKLSIGKGTTLVGAGWASSIVVGVASVITQEGAFSASTPSVPPPCNDNNVCTVDECVGGGTSSGFCHNTPAPQGTSCADGVFCNGVELCDGAGQCQPGTPLSAGTSCADDNLCNGAEACNGFGSCQPGVPPNLNDGDSCTADACDPQTGVSHQALPDGTHCSNGICQGGACQHQVGTFTADFGQWQDTTPQCDAWNSFRGELTSNAYSSVTISGTFDTTGVTCDDPAAATQICQALHNSSGFGGVDLSVFCNGRTWNVGACGTNSVELSADGSTCSCTYGYVARPCIGSFNPNWGGANTSTCYGPSQNITVICK